MITIDQTRCTGCGVCLSLCLQEAIVLQAARAEIKQDLCIGCGICVSACPERAIQDVDLAPVVRPYPGRHDREPAFKLSPTRAERPPARRLPAGVAREPRSVLERRPIVAATLMTMGPFAMDLAAGLAKRWLARPGFPGPTTGARESISRAPGDRRRRRWRGGRCPWPARR